MTIGKCPDIRGCLYVQGEFNIMFDELNSKFIENKIH